MNFIDLYRELGFYFNFVLLFCFRFHWFLLLPRQKSREIRVSCRHSRKTSIVLLQSVLRPLSPLWTREQWCAPPRLAHADLASLAPHERLPKILVVPRVRTVDAHRVVLSRMATSLWHPECSRCHGYVFSWGPLPGWLGFLQRGNPEAYRAKELVLGEDPAHQLVGSLSCKTRIVTQTPLGQAGRSGLYSLPLSTEVPVLPVPSAAQPPPPRT